MRTKPGVNLDDLDPVVQEALPLIEAARLEALEECFHTEMTITSGAEGTPGDRVHSARSLHYQQNCPNGKGLAVDLSVMDILLVIQAALARVLGPGWDVVLEIPETCPGCGRRQVTPHMHNERDFKKRPL